MYFLVTFPVFLTLTAHDLIVYILTGIVIDSFRLFLHKKHSSNLSKIYLELPRKNHTKKDFFSQHGECRINKTSLVFWPPRPRGRKRGRPPAGGDVACLWESPSSRVIQTNTTTTITAKAKVSQTSCCSCRQPRRLSSYSTHFLRVAHPTSSFFSWTWLWDQYFHKESANAIESL